MEVDKNQGEGEGENILDLDERVGEDRRGDKDLNDEMVEGSGGEDRRENKDLNDEMVEVVGEDRRENKDLTHEIEVDERETGGSSKPKKKKKNILKKDERIRRDKGNHCVQHRRS